MKTEIYLAHAHTGALEDFRNRMLALRHAINSIPGAVVLEFNWIPGVGPDRSNNTYLNDMALVHKAGLMVAILDHPSIELGMEIQKRCMEYQPLRCFVREGTKLSQIIPDCITHFRGIGPEGSDLPDPIVYWHDEEIIGCISNWILDNSLVTFR